MRADTPQSATSSAPTLTVEGLSHYFGSRRALHELSLAASPRETVGLMGPNGSGKSTALALLSGTLRLQTGSIRYSGGARAGSARHLREELGVVFQSPSLDDKLTATQNLQLAARLHALPAHHAKPRIEHQLDLAGLTERRDEPVGSFSGGMRRRLDIARATLHEPRILLMDEPTTGLDEAAFRTTWERLRAMTSGRDMTIVVATHRSEEAEHCDRLVVLNEGATVATDTPAALRARVASDVIVLQCPSPKELRNRLQQEFSLKSFAQGHELVIECDEGHKWIPRIVESCPAGTFTSVSLRRPSLADVFLKLTGFSLDGERQTNGEQANEMEAS